jgi:uncharacterized membrane protein SpoIIM required for sporulation
VKQQQFELLHAESWDRFAIWLDQRKNKPKDKSRMAFADLELPARYRRLCQHLALAKDRQYSPALVERLNALVLRGHHLLYGARGGRRGSFLQFVAGGFPRLVRSEARLMWIAALLFFGPLLALMAVSQMQPEIAYYFVAPDQLAAVDDMYGAGAAKLGRRGGDTDFAMFGFYIYNNVKIGFQVFATGLLFCAGSIFFLLFNGIELGAIAGFITSSGHAENFFSFVAGHSGFELTAIAISGGAGLKLGMALINPGLRTRQAALLEASKVASQLALGAALMFLVAAVIEAFWSPQTLVPPESKYGVGVLVWTLVLLYLFYGGRQRAA